MDERKVQVTGRSSYIITLPKDWIVSNKIKKNDTVFLRLLPNGNLMIIPKVDSKKSSLSKHINADNFKDPSLMFRLLVSAYVTGYSEIVVKGNLDQKKQNAIRKFIEKTIGVEIVEEGDSHIIIRDVLEFNQIPFEKSIKRMLTLIKRSFNDLIECIENRDYSIAKEIENRDDEIDKIHWLITRQYHMIIRRAHAGEEIELNILQASNYLMIARYLERIGDHLTNISKNLETIIENAPKEILQRIGEGLNISSNMINSSIESFMNLNIDRANEIIEDVRNLNTLYEKMYLDSLKYQSKLAIAINYVAESIKRIGEYSADISEKTLDYWIERY